MLINFIVGVVRPNLISKLSLVYVRLIYIESETRKSTYSLIDEMQFSIL